MRILLFSDLHGHAFKPYSDMLPDGRNSRLQDTLNILNEIEMLAETRNVNGVLFAGDMFHARSTIHVRAFNEICQKLACINLRVDFFGVLVGNHDQSDRKGTVYSTDTFRSFLTVMDQPGWYTFNTRGTIETVHVYAVPYHPDKRALLERLHTRYDGSDPALFLGHFGISGGKAGANFVLVSEHEINLNELPHNEFDQVFLGHYHLPQELLPNVRFLGATHQHNWGDTGQQRGCWIWDTEQKKPTFIPLNSAPNFVSIPYDTVISPKAALLDLVENCFVRVVCPETLTPTQWAEAATVVMSCNARKVEPWIETEPVTELEPVHSKFNPGADFETMIYHYVGDTKHALDADKLIDLGQSILREAGG